ncbi:MAG: ABC transporter substrate-binding protein, partial [Candidatus Scalindua sp.]
DITKQSEYCFRYHVTSRQEGSLLANYFANAELQKIAVFYINDEYGISVLNELEGYSKERFKILHKIAFGKTETNFRNLIAKTKEVKNYLAIGYGNSFINLIKQLKETRPNAKIYTNYALAVTEFRRPLGNAAQGIIFTTPLLQNTSEKNQFIEEYEKRYNNKPNLIAEFSYDTVKALKAFYNVRDNFDINMITDSLSKIRFKSINGYEIRFDRNREAIFNMGLAYFDKNNELHFVPKEYD